MAGPVVVCGVRIPRGWRPKRALARRASPSRSIRVPLRDSKKLTALSREEWYRYFKTQPLVAYALARVSPRVIDRMNISKAANLAALRAWKGLVTRNQGLGRNAKVFLDGGLYLGNGRGRLPAKTVVRGYEKIAAVKIASIIAKVTRDRHMRRLAKKFPQYGFEIHKGYGTRAHYAAIRVLGVSVAHRATFLHTA